MVILPIILKHVCDCCLSCQERHSIWNNNLCKKSNGFLPILAQNSNQAAIGPVWMKIVSFPTTQENFRKYLCFSPLKFINCKFSFIVKVLWNGSTQIKNTNKCSFNLTIEPMVTLWYKWLVWKRLTIDQGLLVKRSEDVCGWLGTGGLRLALVGRTT